MMLQWLWHWYPEYIKAKMEADREAKAAAKEEAKSVEPERTITLCSNDTSLTRARNICRNSGLVMNMTMMSMIPAMVEVIDAYRKLDGEAAAATAAQKRKRKVKE